MNVDDIRNVVFDKAMRGYRMDEVDAFLAQVAAEFEKLNKEKDDLEKKLYILADKVDQYRNDEDTLKTALLNAQRMGESVIYEARQKAETIVYDANTKASQVRDEANQHVADMEMQLNRLKAEVANFKSSVLTLYRQHIELLSQIPGEEHAARREAPAAPIVTAKGKKPAPEQKKAQAAKAQPEEQPEEKPAAPARKSTKKAAKPAPAPVEEAPDEDDYRTIAFDFDADEDDEPYEDDGYEGGYGEEEPLEVPRTPFDDEEDEEDELRPARPSDLDSYHDISLD